MKRMPRCWNGFGNLGNQLQLLALASKISMEFLTFSKFDLYTKSTKLPDIEALKPYYQGLIDKFIPGVVKF